MLFETRFLTSSVRSVPNSRFLCDPWQTGRAGGTVPAMPDHIRYLETTRFRVAPGAKVRLDKLDPAATEGMAKQDGKVRKLEATVGQLQSALKAQAAQIQKVSEQLGTQVPRVVTSD